MRMTMTAANTTRGFDKMRELTVGFTEDVPKHIVRKAEDAIRIAKEEFDAIKDKMEKDAKFEKDMREEHSELDDIDFTLFCMAGALATLKEGETGYQIPQNALETIEVATEWVKRAQATLDNIELPRSAWKQLEANKPQPEKE